jgi:predicted O-methyltransferase YrrM
MHKSWFEKIGGLDEVNYGSMGAEAQEVCLKTWLSGGRYVLNRKTWYAHKKKRLSAKHRGYRKPTKEWDKSRKYAVKCWMNNEWPLQTRPIAWLVEKFKPIPIWHINSATVKSNRIIQRLYKLNSTIEEYPRMIPGFNRDSFVRLLNDLNYKVGCEVGVQTGVLSWMMFQAIPDLKMYLVDPYIDYKGCKKYRDTHVTSEQRALERMEGKNVVWLREFSETAYNKVPDESLDFVYIDGNHEYDYVMLDIILWQRKVRKGGMISGHDYSTRGKDKIRPIKRVVDDYTQFHNIVPWYVTDNTAVKHAADRHASWFWIK